MRLLRDLGRSLRRVFTGASLYAQALAFNMFLTIFPMLLFVLGLLASSRRASAVFEELLRMRWILPPGSEAIIFDYLQQHSVNPAKWLAVGLTGTLLAGTHCMSVLLASFRHMEGDADRPAFWRQHLRALALLCLAVGPGIAAVMLTAFGRQVRRWLSLQVGGPAIAHQVWLWIAVAAALLVALIILALLYRVGQPRLKSWQDVLPGAALAIGLWWLVNVAFGIYVRRTPYSPIYGGLAAVIGLLVWMQLSALVILLGAAFNVERAGSLLRNR
jgi:membrane protein